MPSLWQSPVPQDMFVKVDLPPLDSSDSKEDPLAQPSMRQQSRAKMMQQPGMLPRAQPPEREQEVQCTDVVQRAHAQKEETGTARCRGGTLRVK